MTYTADIPLSGETLGSTRDRTRSNFQQIASLIAQNHIPFNTAGQGKHKFLQMPEQLGSIGQVGVPLPPTTLANEGGLYTKVGLNPAETNLVFRGESDGFEYQMTRVDQANVGRFATTPNGWTFLPGGLILQWGSVSSPGTSGTVTYATANINFPVDTIQVQLQIYRTDTSANETAIVRQDIPPTNSQFFYRTTASSPSTVMKWTALGY